MPTSQSHAVRHPKGIYFCVLSELFERFSYYSLRALLILYMTKALLFDDSASYSIFAAYMALNYGLTILGGMLADQYLGNQRAIRFGALCMAVGLVLLMWSQAAAVALYIGLGFVAMGTGLFKSNVSTLLGKMYDKHDERKDSGYTIFYMGINLGAFLGPITCGLVGELYGWNFGFSLAAAGMLISLGIAWLGRHFFGYHGVEPNVPSSSKKRLVVYVGVVCLVPLVALLIRYNSMMHMFMPSLAIVAVSILLYVGKVSKTFSSMGVIAVLMIFHAAFFALFDQAGSSMNLFADRNVDRSTQDIQSAFSSFNVFPDASSWQGILLHAGIIGLIIASWVRVVTGKMRTPIAVILTLASAFVLFIEFMLWLGSHDQVPASLFLSVNPVFIVLCAPILASFWDKMRLRGLDLSIPVKFSVGLVFVGLGFFVLSLSQQHACDGLVSMWWVVIAYLLHTIGELCISPVGLSMISKLAPERFCALIMGIWFFSVSFAQYLGGMMSRLASMPAVDSKALQLEDSLAVYCDVFYQFALWGVGLGAVLWVISPLIKKYSKL